MEPTPRPVPALAGTKAYSVPRTLAPIDLKLDGNEGLAPPQSVLESLAKESPEILRCYPKTQKLEAFLATKLSINHDQIIVTAGGDDALDRICRAFLCPGREMIMPTPSFEMIPRYAKLTGGKVVAVPWPPGQAYPVESVLQRITAQTHIIVVVTPNNPTGAIASNEDLAKLSAAAPHALLLIDLAYIEFADKDLTPDVLALDNAVAVRTVSKAWGLAGLRVGYAISKNPAIITALRASGAPYSVSGPSIALALSHLPNDDQQEVFITRIRRERDNLIRHLRSLGCDAYPSQGNFVLARFANATWVRDALAGLGIAVRLFPNKPDLEGTIRITCPGNKESYDRLIAALESTLSPKALLLDLDGVLANVSGSYRFTILETAKTYDVELTQEDVRLAKAAGDANNDWILTHRLLSQRGIDTSLEEVTKRFEDIYQGSPDKPGTRSTETLIVDASVVTRLARTYPIAIVTGRPRADAERFLMEQSVLDPIQTLVCMEDGPSKPDPTPVRLALTKLGVSRAWMVGDTPDDITAARAAGVLPIGVIAPGEDKEKARQTLLKAGAAKVLDTIEELRKMLP